MECFNACKTIWTQHKLCTIQSGIAWTICSTTFYARNMWDSRHLISPPHSPTSILNNGNKKKEIKTQFSHCTCISAFCLHHLLYPQRYHSDGKLLLNSLAEAMRTLQAHVGDESLLQELVHMPFSEQECLGIVLVSQLSSCVKCGGNIIPHSDQRSNLFLYTESHGTLPAVQYNKYYSRKKCNLTTVMTRMVEWVTFTTTKGG